MSRPISNVMLESLIIGIMNAVIILGLSKININTPIIYLIAGALIHIIFEYSGGNKWWCEQTYKL